MWAKMADYMLAPKTALAGSLYLGDRVKIGPVPLRSVSLTTIVPVLRVNQVKSLSTQDVLSEQSYPQPDGLHGICCNHGLPGHMSPTKVESERGLYPSFVEWQGLCSLNESQSEGSIKSTA